MTTAVATGAVAIIIIILALIAAVALSAAFGIDLRDFFGNDDDD